MFQLPPGMNYQQFVAAGMPGYRSDVILPSPQPAHPPKPQAEVPYDESAWKEYNARKAEEFARKMEAQFGQRPIGSPPKPGSAMPIPPSSQGTPYGAPRESGQEQWAAAHRSGTQPGYAQGDMAQRLSSLETPEQRLARSPSGAALGQFQRERSRLREASNAASRSEYAARRESSQSPNRQQQPDPWDGAIMAPGQARPMGRSIAPVKYVSPSGQNLYAR